MGLTQEVGLVAVGRICFAMVWSDADMRTTKAQGGAHELVSSKCYGSGEWNAAV